MNNTRLQLPDPDTYSEKTNCCGQATLESTLLVILVVFSIMALAKVIMELDQISFGFLHTLLALPI